MTLTQNQPVTAGEVLADRSPSGKVRPWGVHKLMNGLLALAYEDVDVKKAERLKECASLLAFKKTETGMRLKSANFCRVRLCPMCMWRRSLKVQSQIHQIMIAMRADAVKEGGKEYAFIYLTLTQRNCQPEQLAGQLDKLRRGWDKLTKAKEYTAVVHGFYKAVEVTHNVEEDTYHPHIHALLAVNKSYFTSRDYIPHDTWVKLWRRSMKLTYDPNVDVRKVKGNTAKAVAEAAGYGLKASSYIIPDDWDLTVETVRLLDAVLANRRFIGFGGVFREYQRRLKLDDPEDGDLVHTGEDEPGYAGDHVIYYAWYSGYRQYRQIDG